jgi:hypothetical protein
MTDRRATLEASEPPNWFVQLHGVQIESDDWTAVINALGELSKALPEDTMIADITGNQVYRRVHVKSDHLHAFPLDKWNAHVGPLGFGV